MSKTEVISQEIKNFSGNDSNTVIAKHIKESYPDVFKDTQLDTIRKRVGELRGKEKIPSATKSTIEMVDCGDFLIGKYPVTQKQYEEVMGNNPSYFKGPNRPVESVSWYDAVEFCNKLSEKEGLQKVYSGYGFSTKCDFTANGYRLATANEWKFASEGGYKGKGYKYSGGDYIDKVAWYEDNSENQTQEVGTKQPNELGIYDMTGNVWEWCWDILHRRYRASMGRGWNATAYECEFSCNPHPGTFLANLPNTKSSNYGFRVVRSKTKGD